MRHCAGCCASAVSRKLRWTSSARAGIAGAVHICIGQEATIVGACLALRDDDYMVGYHRSHGHPIAKGAELAPLMAELMGAAPASVRARVVRCTWRISGWAASVRRPSSAPASRRPPGRPTAPGQGYRQMALSFFGDGGANIGSFHEGLNLASVWGLGAVFVCENNLYAMSTPLAETMASDSIAARAAAYRMPGVCVDGQDVVAVYDAVSGPSTEPGPARVRRLSSPGPTGTETTPSTGI